ncbi:MAG TPA: class I SAM-dependent methyltransferase [Chitinophagaceae bacterium]
MPGSVKHTANDFETLYIRLRQKEGRVYTNEEVAQLPHVNPVHPHYKEWQLRQESAQRLIDYLKKKKQLLTILEIGCGNGWLSHRLAAIPGSKVIGTDINFTEVQQAAKVFQDKPNLHFIYGHAETGIFEDMQFDIILFAASIQYFPSLPTTIGHTLKLLRPGGEIHIIDSPFYPVSELSAARQRSLLYFQAAGFPEMAGCYFHHSLEYLEKFNYSVRYDPDSLFNRFLRNKNPFPWICIQH